MQSNFDIQKILKLDKKVLDQLEQDMAAVTGKSGVVAQMEREIQEKVQDRLGRLGLKNHPTSSNVALALAKMIAKNEQSLYDHAGIRAEDFGSPESAARAFEKIKSVADEVRCEGCSGKGFFLKKEKAEEILYARPPKGALEYFGYKDTRELLKKQDIVEVMSALRFTETNEWMHETFDAAYGGFTKDDFEERHIELRMLGPQWHDIASKFVKKKHHNVSHLKEFGVIFLNPINQGAPGALFRDFALFFHYFHEVTFYSDLFRMHAEHDNFAEELKSFLRGDVPEKSTAGRGEWLIVQRYLWKENANDPRLFLPRVNPEALHWHKGEQDLAEFSKKHPEINIDFWDDMDWVGAFFPQDHREPVLISFDLEDNAMSYVTGGSDTHYGHIRYHQQEALWNEIFRRYVGDKRRDELIMENFDKGVIKFDL